jgi:hypothetical protein
MKMEQTECSETAAYKIQMPGNYPEENIQQVFFLLNAAFAMTILALISGVCLLPFAIMLLRVEIALHSLQVFLIYYNLY